VVRTSPPHQLCAHQAAGAPIGGQKVQVFIQRVVVAYLGHVASVDGVAMDAQKVQAVPDWPLPRSARVVWAFLGLTGYYRQFIKDYGAIAAPLTKLLHKEGFHWSTEAKEVFRSLQRVLTSAPMLQLPDFAQGFIVECDASGSGMGVVLHQAAGPVIFFS
jgi:hypothetical protein